MGEETLRDEVWIETLETLRARGELKSSDIDVEMSQRSRREVFRAMEEHGWLTRDTDESKIWRVGPRARKLLNLSEEAKANVVD